MIEEMFMTESVGYKMAKFDTLQSCITQYVQYGGLGVSKSGVDPEVYLGRRDPTLPIQNTANIESFFGDFVSQN